MSTHSFYSRNKSFVFGRTCYVRKSSISVRKRFLKFPRSLTRNQVKTDRQGRGVLKYFGFSASRNLQNWYCCCWCRRMKVALVCLIILYILREVRFGKIWTSSCFRVFRATIYRRYLISHAVGINCSVLVQMALFYSPSLGSCQWGYW